MGVLHVPLAFLPGGWAHDVRVVIEAGRIASVTPDTPAAGGDTRLDGLALLPAVANLHSHAFQRAMAGRTERRGAGAESFWTWRDTMYRLLETMDPDDVEAIAALAYVEMLEAGFAAVGEFHYLHHPSGGGRYAAPAEMAHRIVAAAEAAGIGLTLLPVLYTHAGAAGGALAGGQLRFGCDVDGFMSLHAEARRGLAEDGVLGAAPHSLRAVTPETAATLAEALPEGPLHIHAAEQTREVEELLAVHGARPVALLLDRVGIGPRWCVIHATHMTAHETGELAASGAVAGLCPVTEANLGDGIFPGPAFVEAGGRYGVGSDSNVRIDLAEELRLLEYGQRLQARARHVLAPPGGSTGEALWRAAAEGGAQALGRETGAIRPGAWADLVAVDTEAVGLPLDCLLDGLVFARTEGALREVWSAGRHVVRGGRHVARDRIEASARARLRALAGRL